MRTIIGLTGYAKHGKDTVGAVAVEEFGFTRFAFADLLKSMALTLDPIVYIDHEAEKVIQWRSEYARLKPLVEHVGWDVAKEAKEVRRFLQVLGTEAVRDHLGQDTWVTATFGSFFGAHRVVITDARFPNEFAAVKRHGVLIRVTRRNADGTPYDNGLGTDHPSEQHIASAPADIDIVANTGVPVLQSIAREVIGTVVRDRES